MSVLIKHSDRFSATDIDDEIVVMRLDNGEFFSLAGTAAAIWRLIDGSRDRDTLIEAIAREYKTDQEQIAADVDQFIVHLTELGLIAPA